MRSELRGRIARAGFSQERVAIAAGYSAGLFSRYLRGVRTPPQDFFPRVEAALSRLEAAERAADKARRRILEQEDSGADEEAPAAGTSKANGPDGCTGREAVHE